MTPKVKVQASVSAMTSKITPLASAVALACSITAVPAMAQQADAPAVQELAVTEASASAENEVSVRQSSNVKFNQPLVDTAKTINVIPKAVMQERAVDSLRDALRNVSGISLAAGEGGAPAGDSVSIRGFSARTDVFVDGIRDIAGYSRDTYNLESVEVAKGPSAAVYGRGATGGSINLQSKTARLEQFTELSLRGGSEGDYRVMLDTNTQVSDATALRLNAVADDVDVAGRNQVNNSKQAAALSVSTAFDSSRRLTLNAEYQQQDNMPDYGIPWVPVSDNLTPELAAYAGKAPPVNFDNFYGNVYRDYEDIKAQSLTGRYEQDLSADTQLRIQARAGSVAREGVVTAPRFASVANSTDVRLSDEKTRDTRDKLLALQADLITNFNTGAVKHDLVTGLEWAEETFTRWNMVDLVDDNLDSTPELVDLYQPNPFVAFSGRYGRDGNSIEATGKTLALYAFDTMTLSQQWMLTLGGRWDRFSTDYQYSYTDPTLSVDTRDTLFSWNAALVYKPAANGSVYLALGNSHNPSAEGLTVSTNSNSNLITLDAEETLSYELGTKWLLLDEKLQANVALFRTEKVHARTDDPDFSGGQSSFDTLNGRQRVQGIELSATGYLTASWTLTGAYTWQDSEVTRAEGDDAGQIGNALSNTPEHSLSLWSRYDISDKLTAGAGAQYVAERYNSSAPSRRVAPGYTSYDLMLSYQFSEQLGVQFNALNLTDKRYIEQLGGGHFIPGAGRQLSVTARYQF